MHVCLISPIPRGFLHQRPQQIADRLQQYGATVTYVEPRGINEARSEGMGIMVREAFRSVPYYLLALLALLFPVFSRSPRRRSRRRELPANVRLPFVLPVNRFNARSVERIAAAVWRQALRRNVLRHLPPGEDCVALVQHPFWGAVMREGDFDRLYYDCIDELSLYAGHASPIRFQEYERNLCGISNAVFVTARALEAHLHELGCGAPTYRVPNGVDFEWFQKRAKTGVPAPVKGLRAPVVGYVGALREWFDYGGIARTAERHPEMSFVLVGPAINADNLRVFQKVPNVLLVGAVPYDEVPRYIGSFQVCLIPFLPGRIADNTNPVKLFEYFALGKPVVASHLTELEPYNDLVWMGEWSRDADTFIAAALAEQGEQANRRMIVASEHSWDVLVAFMHRVMQGKEGGSV
jgi:glycosyltransferase involved in cell wall biosynthesis